jgi:hypothetical protein
MFTKVVAGIETLADDALLLDAIKGAADPWDRPNPQGSFRIGIANELGQIYRTVSGDDLQEFADTHDALLSAGLVDRFTVGDASIEGFDAIVQRTLAPLASEGRGLSPTIVNAVPRQAEQRPRWAETGPLTIDQF